MTLIPFTYEDQQVRVVDIGGEPWFVLADLCRVLDLSNSRMVAQRLGDDVRHVLAGLDSLGRAQNAYVVNESGMYEVVIRSDKPEAATFRRWITADVLPSIRKTGAYSTPRELSPDEIVHQALQITHARVLELTATVDDQQQRLKIAEPKANAFDRWLGSGVEYSLDVAAKALSASGYMTGRNRLFAELAELGWAYRGAHGWHPRQQHGPEGTKRLAVRLFYYDDPATGEARGKSTLKITAKGIADLARLHGILPENVAKALGDEAAA